MNLLSVFLPFVVGVALGGGLVWLVARAHFRADSLWADRFQNLANKIFEEKAARFKQDSHDGISQLLTPLRERLQEFQKKIDDSFGAQAKEQFSLRKEIERIVAVNEKMTLEAQGLSKAIKGDVKAQGNWGEVMLEKILEESGLRRERDYIVQAVELGLRHAENGNSLRPDIIVMLPEDKHVIIDSKVSLTHYIKYCEAADEAGRQAALKEYLSSIRKHVDGLEQRRYQDAEKLGTPDFVLMFMPVEGAYSLAVQQDTKLHSYAWDKKIVIVCPSTLFASLRTIASVWKIELQNRNAVEIAKRGGALYDKIFGFVEDMQKLGKQIDTAGKLHDQAMNKLAQGRGNILSQTETLRELGAKASKRLPVELLGSEGEAVGLVTDAPANEDAA